MVSYIIAIDVDHSTFVYLLFMVQMISTSYGMLLQLVISPMYEVVNTYTNKLVSDVQETHLLFNMHTMKSEY